METTLKQIIEEIFSEHGCPEYFTEGDFDRGFDIVSSRFGSLFGRKGTVWFTEPVVSGSFYLLARRESGLERIDSWREPYDKSELILIDSEHKQIYYLKSSEQVIGALGDEADYGVKHDFSTTYKVPPLTRGHDPIFTGEFETESGIERCFPRIAFKPTKLYIQNQKTDEQTGKETIVIEYEMTIGEKTVGIWPFRFKIPGCKSTEIMELEIDKLEQFLERPRYKSPVSEQQAREK